MTVDGIEVQRSQTAATGKRTTSDGSNAVRYDYRSQTTATGKRTFPNRSNALRYDYRSQTAAIQKRLISDGSNSGRYGYRSQTAAIGKRPLSDGSNFIRCPVVFNKAWNNDIAVHIVIRSCNGRIIRYFNRTI